MNVLANANNGAAVATAMCATTASTAATAHPPLVKCFHFTTPTAARSILATQFNRPTKQEGQDRGLKMGAGVYFGLDKQYCQEEAKNTIRDAWDHTHTQSKKSKEEKEREPVVACLVAEIDLTHCLDLTAINYEDGCKGKLTWPFPCYNDKGKCVLPNGKLIAKNKILKRRKWDACTETIDSDYLTKMDIDTIMFRIDDTIEIAVYNIDRILNVREVPSA